MQRPSLKNATKHLNKRLRFMLRIYLIIAIILLGILAYNVIQGILRLDWGLAGLGLGILVGIFSSRMYHISWDRDARKIVNRLDLYGAFILILYITFEIFKGDFVGFLTHDVQVTSIGFAILAGDMLGRFIGTRGKILKVLKEQKVFRK